MSNGIYVAVSGAMARQRQIDVTANNLANLNTIGFRGQRLAFREVLKDNVNAPNRHMVGVDPGGLDLREGALKETGRPLDLAIEGPGFFVTEDLTGEKVLRRSMSLQVRDDGRLYDEAGRRVLTDSKGLRFAQSTEVHVSKAGTVYSGDEPVARLATVNVAYGKGLVPKGNGGYVTSMSSGDFFTVDSRVLTGVLERSNVNAVQEMVSLVTLERDYQSIIKVISAYRDADQNIVSASESGR